jgi:cellulose synthase/poly-beta-1,6-N-acetylglucosamine synthase-like glycosyltransferase
LLGVTIVIPAYNAEKTIAECLTAVQDQDWGNDTEVILVNDGSTDKTAEIAATFSGVKVITTPNGGAPRATNVGISAARRDIVVSVDSDAMLDRGWPEKVMPWFDDPEVGAVCGYVRCASKSLVGRVMGYHLELRMDRSPTYVGKFGSTNTAYRRSALIEVGMLDEQVKIGYDIDVTRNLRAAGYRLVREKRASCRHFSKDTLNSFCRQQYQFAYYRLKLTKKHKRVHDGATDLSMILQVPFTALVTLAAVLGSLFLSPLFLLALVLLLVIHFGDAASILLKKKDLAVAIALPIMFTLRNFVWTYAAMIWGLRCIFGINS